MKITKNLNGTSLTVALEGRLDTTTAPELEQALKESMDAATELTLDFSKLDYISSAGLRVLLAAHKAMAKGAKKGSMDVNLLYAFDMESQEPVAVKPYPGNMLDMTAVQDFIASFPVSSGLLVMDKGFSSEASFISSAAFHGVSSFDAIVAAFRGMAVGVLFGVD